MSERKELTSEGATMLLFFLFNVAKQSGDEEFIWATATAYINAIKEAKAKGEFSVSKAKWALVSEIGDP